MADPTPAAIPAPIKPAHPSLSPLIQSSLAAFESVDLDEMENVALLNRVDTKYLLTERQLAVILQRACAHYRVLTINNARAGAYRSLYFDTPDFRMYLDHHNGLRDRYKVRVRQYVTSSIAFLEVKRKTNRDRTVKTRIPVSPALNSLLGVEGGFVEQQTPYRVHQLLPDLANSFLRTTLVGRDVPERVTLDFGLQTTLRGAEWHFPGLVIAEVKQAKFDAQSPFVRELRALHVEARSFSKYCMGIALLVPDIRANRFKAHRLFLDRLLAVRRTNPE